MRVTATSNGGVTGTILSTLSTRPLPRTKVYLPILPYVLPVVVGGSGKHMVQGVYTMQMHYESYNLIGQCEVLYFTY